MGSFLSYFDQLCKTMGKLSMLPRTLFIGQGVGCAGTTMTDTLREVRDAQLLEFPVAEEMQMGFATGLALEGWLPICIYPRWNFLLCATNQLVNHLDKLSIYSNGGYNPKVIIRVAIPSRNPFDPGPQHDGDFTYPFKTMLRTVNVVTLNKADQIAPAYAEAVEARHSTLLVERTALYGAIPTGVPQRKEETA